jgi:hypothetical protein
MITAYHDIVASVVFYCAWLTFLPDGLEKYQIGSNYVLQPRSRGVANRFAWLHSGSSAKINSESSPLTMKVHHALAV